MPSRSLSLALVGLFAVVLLSRAPFLDAGYGVNVDAWRIANAARGIAWTHGYMVSRFPGYPVQEIVCSLLWRGGKDEPDWRLGPAVLNGASALLGALAVVLFALLARQAGCKDYLLAAAGLAFCPLFYVSSVTAKDYVWALALCLASMLCTLRARPVVAGVFLGLAIGCRITSGAMALPFCLLLVNAPEASGAATAYRGGVSARRIALFGVSATVTAALAFLPVAWKYGMGFLTFYSSHDRPGWGKILNRATIEVWGWPGIAGLALALAGALCRVWRPSIRTSLSCPRFHVVAWVAIVVIYLVAFLSLPDQAGYLMPVLPFVFLLAARFAPRLLFQAFCLLAALGSFVTIQAGKIAPGAIYQDHAERVAIVQNVRNFVAFASMLPGRNVIVVGSWEPLISQMPPAKTAGDTRFSGIMTPAELLDCLKEHFSIYYLPEMREYNYRVNGLDLARYGARNLRTLYEEKRKNQ